MKKFSFIVAIFNLVLIAISNAEARNVPCALVVKAESAEILNAVLIDENTVIKFDNDSILLFNKEWRGTISKNEALTFSHEEDCRSQMVVRVYTGEDSIYPLENMTVMLHNDDMMSFYGIVQITDEKGVATFMNVPTARYSVSVRDENSLFNNYISENVIHCYKDGIDVKMEENVILPRMLSYSLNLSDIGNYNIYLYWDLGDFGLENEAMGYLFSIYMDGELMGTTSDFCYTLEDIEPGEHEIAVNSISSFGNHSIGSRNITISLDTSTSRESIQQEDETYTYFDLNGVPISQENIRPGIYIKHFGSGKTQKILIK